MNVGEHCGGAASCCFSMGCVVLLAPELLVRIRCHYDLLGSDSHDSLACGVPADRHRLSGSAERNDSRGGYRADEAVCRTPCIGGRYVDAAREGDVWLSGLVCCRGGRGGGSGGVTMRAVVGFSRVVARSICGPTFRNWTPTNGTRRPSSMPTGVRPNCSAPTTRRPSCGISSGWPSTASTECFYSGLGRRSVRRQT